MTGDEVWVHLSGPSSTTDDIQYREMLQAYGEFDAVKTYSTLPREHTDPEKCGGSVACPLQTYDQAYPVTETPTRDDGLETVDQQCIIPRSIAAKSNKNAPSCYSGQSLDYIGETPAAMAALESQLLTSSLLPATTTSPIACRIDNNGCIRANTSSVDAASEELPVFSLEPVPHAREKGQAPAASITNRTSTSPSQARKLGITKPNTPIQRTFTYSDKSKGKNFNEILPPSPPIALSPPPLTFITPKLQQLADMLDLRARFKPAQKLRNLHIFERGYWRVDTVSWSAKLKAEFWAYLEEFIHAGAAGWGVSCYVEPPYDENDTAAPALNDASVELSPRRSRANGFVQSFRHARIYCWGEIVGHVYLLAFVASRSKVKHVSCTWIDAEGIEVIQMH